MYSGVFVKPHINKMTYERPEFIGYYKPMIASFSALDNEKFKYTLSTCTTCEARKEARQVVIPEGSFTSDTVFVGRNPGWEEDLNCKPFFPTATAGSWFMKYLEALGVDRGNIYITNSLLCHTKKDRPPTDQELLWCSIWRYLEFLRLTNMKYLFLLGGDALKQTMGYEFMSIMRIFGDVYQTRFHGRQVLVFPVPHPAAAWRNREMARNVFAYLEAAKDIIAADREGRLKWLV
jgi:DNA polymerase